MIEIKQKYKGIICILASSFSFGLMNVFIRPAGDLPSIQKSFFRNLVAFFFAFMIMKRKGIAFSCKKENRRTLILRSVFGNMVIAWAEVISWGYMFVMYVGRLWWHEKGRKTTV